MIAIDANILVYAHRRGAEWYRPAAEAVEECWSGERPWMIPWPCLHEFYSVVTNPRLPDRPSTIHQAVEQINAWLESPSVVLAAEQPDHWDVLAPLLTPGRVTGGMIYDAKIAAICMRSGVTTFWTADRDYGRFPSLRCENPLVRRK